MNIFDLGDPSLASALNSRYNGTQLQGTIYDSNSLPQAGSPVPQVYTTTSKPETAYWHQAPEYNVNPVSANSFFLLIFLFVFCFHLVKIFN